MTQPEVKPVINWPGYFVSKDGLVFSSRNNKTGQLAPVKVNSRGKVNLTFNGRWKHFKPADLAAEAWRPRWSDKP